MAQYFQKFTDILAYLETLGLFHMDLSLARISRVLGHLKLLDPPFYVVQIVGTNGKGSTASFLAALCQAHGLRAGLYTSPHFVQPTERIKVCGRDIASSMWVESANYVRELGPDLTYFEFLTVLALLFFKAQQIDVAILEAGLGGAHDATTAVRADIIAYTPIALDHQNILGQGLASIAKDKACAIRGKAQVYTVDQYPVAAKYLAKACAKEGIILGSAPILEPSLRDAIGLFGQHQYVNAGLALKVFQAMAQDLKLGVKRDLVELALRQTFIPGRLQHVAASENYPDMLLDGGHNPHGMQTMLQALRHKVRPQAIVYAGLADKDWRAVLRILAQEFRGAVPIYFPSINNPRAASAREVCAAWGEKQIDAPLTIGPLLKQLRQAHVATFERPVLVTGSLYLLAEIYALFENLLVAPNLPGSIWTDTWLKSFGKEAFLLEP
ncbi:MAG: bifunctional folylpolyglutamate synthase/ dihydrofolate synthase [Desulfovibrionaceae bacterium]|nr:bifunctional folylpolyglutamate synthase/ dihydrofolate synthase [Desulfovibrionaceae bacterium]